MNEYKKAELKKNLWAFATLYFWIILFFAMVFLGLKKPEWCFLLGCLYSYLIYKYFQYMDKKEKDKKQKEEQNYKEASNRAKKDRKKEEDKNMQKLKSAKTGQPITISKSYGIIGPDGKDTGRRFIRKEDAEKYFKRINS